MDKMNEYHMARRVLIAEVEGGFAVDRSWVDGFSEVGFGQQWDVNLT